MSTEGGRVSFTQRSGERRYYRENNSLYGPKTCRFLKHVFKFICMYISHCVCVHKSIQVPAVDRRRRQPLELELQSYRVAVSAVNQDPVVCKGSQHSLPAQSSLWPHVQIFDKVQSQQGEREHHEPGNETESL